MFIGHFALGFASKRLAPRLPLAAAFVAAQFLDLLWPPLLLAGVESVRVEPGVTAVTPLDFVSYPYSHSLLMSAVWATLFALIILLMKRGRRAAVVAWLLVVSHWLLDFITHRPDLPLTPWGATRVGLGLWNSVAGTLAVELSLFIACVFVYARTTRARERGGAYYFAALVVVLLLVYAANLSGEPPRDPRVIAKAGLGMWLFVVWAWWVDRQRPARDSRDDARRRARRALVRQLAYQRAKAARTVGHEGEYIRAMRARSAHVRAQLKAFRPIGVDARVLEVGSGAHGLVFYFGARRAVGVDPLACEYAKLFPAWQGRAQTIAAAGERLPFADSSFDFVLCDNVVDHAEGPADIVRELARVLAPGGLLYFTVNFHHPFYDAAARLHAAWNDAGLRYEIAPFADHTVHLTLEAARKLFRDLPLRPLEERHDETEARARARRRPPRHAGDRLKRLFFKNALYELVAERNP
jgi:SAM-dependent methyltransferase